VIIKPMDLLLDTQALYNQGLVSGHSTGWDEVDQFFTVRAGELTLVTGMPSHGKSEWLDALMVNLARKHGYVVTIFSPENHPLEMHHSKILEKFHGKHFHKGPHIRMTQDEMSAAVEWANKHFRFVKPADNEYTPLHIINEAATVFGAVTSKPKAMIIDPWNEMDHLRPSQFSETEYISHTLTELRRYAREFNVALFLVAHPMKLAKDKDGNYPVPRPYDISGSAHWYNKADNCIAVWRDVVNAPTETEIHVQKVRFRVTGKPGMAALRYNPATTRYEDDAARIYEGRRG
jgi:twinkle protein